MRLENNGDNVERRKCNIFRMIPKIRDIQGEQISETFRVSRQKALEKRRANYKVAFPDIAGPGVKRKRNRKISMQYNLACLPEI